MKKRIVKLNESDLERLVQRVIKEEEEQSKEKKSATLTKHPAYPVIDELGTRLEDLKRDFKDGIANAVSGSDGYHSEIDKFSSDFTNFIGKLEKLKEKINDYQETDNKRYTEMKQKQMAERKRIHNERKKRAQEGGKNYSY